MKFLIIIPAHNEEENIFYCLKSLENQQFQNFDLMVVNDGSTDNTRGVIENFILNSPIKARVKILNLEPSQHQPGAKVVDCFNKGLAMYDLANYDVICKFDADIIFPTNYLKIVENVYQENPQVAMVSGIVKIKKNDEVVSFQNFLNFEDTSNWTFENISSVKHVRGPIKSYRKKCFLEMNGLRPILGWDNIDVLLANFHGYQTYTEKDLWVKHLRPTAEKYKNQKAIKLGEYFYNIGLSFPLATISSVKSAWKNKSLSEVFVTLNSFLRQKQPLLLTKEETKFVRNYKWKNILQKFNFFQ